MAGILSTANNINMALKESGIVIDMSPAANGQLSSLTNSLRIRHTDESLPDVAPTASNSSAASSMITFRCERCDDFETNSRASLLLHVVQCLSNPSRSKIEEPDPENLSVNSGNLMDQTTADDGTGKLSSESHSSGDAASTMVAVSANSSTNNSSTSSSRKVFECDVCNMKFSNGANMRRHKMRHTGVKPYECRVCQKRFFRKDHLAEHFTTHTKTLPYHCPICNRGFQRQIAMRAHFQNEHVGQHDLVKTCPLCSYRAGSMKSLRIHFFNRHGIDLDNPGPGGTSSLLLALETQATQVAAAAVAANFVPTLNPVATPGVNVNNNMNMPSNQSDSNESLRSAENNTPPMHFLTPHVEISTLSDSGNDMFNVTHDSVDNPSVQSALLCVLRAFALQGNTPTGASRRESLESKFKDQDTIIKSPPPHLPDHPECNAKTLPSSTSSACVPINTPNKPHHSDNHITPSISLIPIKQEPSDELSCEASKGGDKQLRTEQMSGDDIIESDYSSSNNKLTSLIKVSPLKSLLREDLKRRICAKANSRINRNATILENNNAVNKPSTPISSPCNSIPICNGTITSTGQETESPLLNRKQILTCLFCGIEFPDETLYFLHKGCHCDSNPWKCNICGEQCNNVYEFNSHLLSKSHQ